MDIKPVFNEHKVAMYVSIFPKNWRSMLTSHEISSREAFENNMHHHDTMKTIARASLSNQECFIQGVLYNIFQEMNLRRNFLAAYFVSTNLPQKRDWVLLSNKKKQKLSELPDFGQNFSQEIRYLSLCGKTKCDTLQWKVQCFKQFLLCRIFSILHTWKWIKQVNVSQIIQIINWLRFLPCEVAKEDKSF